MIEPDTLQLLSDLLDFCSEKIEEGRKDPTSQTGAISEAAGYVRCVRGQITDEEVIANIMLAWEHAISPGWWQDFAKLDRSEFLERSDGAATGIKHLRVVLGALANVQ